MREWGKPFDRVHDEANVDQHLAFFDSISVPDYIAMMWEGLDEVTEVHVSIAKRELWEAGFSPQMISLAGHRAIFPRYVREPERPED